MNRQKLQTFIDTAKLMAIGAITIILAISIFWSIANIDVLVKAVKYPEVIRQMKVQVTVAPTATK